MYNYKCQVCGESVSTRSGPYVEAAHIQALGKPHDGPDTEANIICLCPNHHVMFDRGGFSINDDHTLNGISGCLFVKPEHKISSKYLKYHREHA